MAKQINNTRDIVCDVCGRKGAQLRYVTRSYGKGTRLLVLENVPLISCPHCGESYFTAATLNEIEKIKRRRVSVAKKRPVAVAVFA